MTQPDHHGTGPNWIEEKVSRGGLHRGDIRGCLGMDSSWQSFPLITSNQCAGKDGKFPHTAFSWEKVEARDQKYENYRFEHLVVR